jgi:hypothetical protein
MYIPAFPDNPIKEVAVRARRLAQAIYRMNPTILPGQVSERRGEVRNRLHLFDKALAHVCRPSVGNWPNAKIACSLIDAQQDLLPRIRGWAHRTRTNIDAQKVEWFIKELVGLSDVLDPEPRGNCHPPERLIIDRRSGTATLDGEPSKFPSHLLGQSSRLFPRKQWPLVRCLMDGKIKSMQDVLDTVYGEDEDGNEGALGQLVKRVNDKLHAMSPAFHIWFADAKLQLTRWTEGEERAEHNS